MVWSCRIQGAPQPSCRHPASSDPRSSGWQSPWCFNPTSVPGSAATAGYVHELHLWSLYQMVWSHPWHLFRARLLILCNMVRLRVFQMSKLRSFLVNNQLVSFLLRLTASQQEGPSLCFSAAQRCPQLNIPRGPSTRHEGAARLLPLPPSGQGCPPCRSSSALLPPPGRPSAFTPLPESVHDPSRRTLARTASKAKRQASQPLCVACSKAASAFSGFVTGAPATLTEPKSVSVASGVHNQVPQPRRLHPQACLFSPFWRLGVPVWTGPW